MSATSSQRKKKKKNRKMQKKKGEKQSRAGECVNDKIKIKTVDDLFFPQHWIQ